MCPMTPYVTLCPLDNHLIYSLIKIRSKDGSGFNQITNLHIVELLEEKIVCRYIWIPLYSTQIYCQLMNQAGVIPVGLSYLWSLSSY